EPKDKPDEEESERKPVTCPTKHSFPPGTRVLAGGGLSLPIEAVRLGEQVLATDPVTGLTTLRTVTRTFTTYDDKDFTRLTTSAGTVTATDTHPFWLVDEHRWADAGDIKPGDQLRLPSGSTLQVTAVTRYTQRQTTHDLTVADLHTYYVLAGRTPVLVHNSSPFCGRPFGNRAGGDDFHGSDYSLDEIVQFVHGHTGGGNPAMGRPSQAEIETTLRKAGPVRIGKQNSAQFDHGGVRVIVNYDMPWKSTAYYPGSLGKS
ncbi:polymorphic toxin-type HINT domain-containing protein, partial [Streptomyces sp.]|uniref:polymorphic toxin-type HINT domain-containing protein n=1 Tax=Streptomyces sp. TaxID=1931 RepID=UPI002F93E8C2